MDSQFVVGIDVGGQTTKRGVVDERGTVLAQTVIRTDTYDVVDSYIVELAEGMGSRRYYAGFSGFVNHPLYETECYVSLRFMEADQLGNLNFYAGGGIMPQSNAESEWNETSHKLNTIMRLITGDA